MDKMNRWNDEMKWIALMNGWNELMKWMVELIGWNISMKWMDKMNGWNEWMKWMNEMNGWIEFIYEWMKKIDVKMEEKMDETSYGWANPHSISQL